MKNIIIRPNASLQTKIIKKKQLRRIKIKIYSYPIQNFCPPERVV